MLPIEPTAVRVVACPRCKKPAVWSPDNAFRPFCSERCKRNDLGAWANDEYRVAAKEDSELAAPFDMDASAH